MQRRHFMRFFALVLLLLMALPSMAQAEMGLKFTNKTTQKVFYSVRYKDNVSGEWVTRGWWNCEPLSSQTIKLNTDNTVIYWYAMAGKSWWGGKDGAATTKKYFVVNEKFLVKGGNKPAGKNLRSVNFKEVRAKEGLFFVNITGN